jgi:hypothetical protein
VPLLAWWPGEPPVLLFASNLTVPVTKAVVEVPRHAAGRLLRELPGLVEVGHPAWRLDMSNER